MLRQPAADSRDAAVRWRQLVDLIARSGGSADPALLTEALRVIRADTPRIDEPLRAAAARAIAALPLPLGLLESFVADRLSVSAPILAAASLDAAQWRAVLAAADAETRRFIATLHPDLEPLAAGPATASPELSIGELVSRIERRRTERGSSAPVVPAPAIQRTPASGAALFQWEAGPSGDIDWVDGIARGTMIGRSLARGPDGGSDRVSSEAVGAIQRRVPFRDCALVVGGEGPAAGQWLLSGTPAFDPLDGRFCGYRGIARRDSASNNAAKPTPTPAEAGSSAMSLDSNALRELVHELKTPLNAIIGFSEIIDGQFLGPAGKRYRDRATGIAGEARTLLSAIDDLDLAAKVYAGDERRAATSQIDGAAIQAVNAMRHQAEARGVELLFAPPAQPVVALIEPNLLARLVGRLLRTAVDCAVSGERLRVAVDTRGARARLTVTRPVALAGSGNADGDYALRVVTGLIRVGGGHLAIEDGMLVADFPAA